MKIGDQDRDDERNHGGIMGLNLTGRDQDEKGNDRQGGRERRDDGTIERIVDLIPHERRSLLASAPERFFFRRKTPIRRNFLRRRTAAVLDEISPTRRFTCMFRTNFVFDLCADTPAGMLW